jgi:hypothetical protein
MAALKYKEAVFSELQIGAVIVLPNQTRNFFLNTTAQEIQELTTIRLFRLVERTENKVSKTFTAELLELGVEKPEVQPLIFAADTKLFEVYEEEEAPAEATPAEATPAEPEVTEAKVDNRKTIKG